MRDSADRLENIKSTHERGTLVRQADISWLITEAEQLRVDRDLAINAATRLRTRLSSAHAQLREALPRAQDIAEEDTLGLLTIALHQRRGAMTELNEIHDILAEALGYQKAPTLEEDPNCPCPGAYVTGDHTAASLAIEAAKKLARRQDHTQALGRALDRANSLIAELTSGRFGPTPGPSAASPGAGTGFIRARCT